MEKWLSILTQVPFFLAVDGNGKKKFNFVWLANALVQAIVVASMIGGFMMVKVNKLENQLSSIQSQLIKQEAMIAITCEKLEKNALDINRIDTLQRLRLERDARGR